MPTRSNDRSCLCAFSFADGRHCRMPRQNRHAYLCAFHARKEAQALAGQQAGADIAYHLSGTYVSACDLSAALGRLFSAVAQGHVKPKTASTLAYLGRTLAQNLPLAQDEYINAFGTSAWRDTIRTSHQQSADHISPDPQPSSEDAATVPKETAAQPDSADSAEPKATETEPSLTPSK